MKRCLCTAGLLALVLAACSTNGRIQPASKPQAPASGSAQKGKPTVPARQDLLDFVIDGRTTCGELHDRLGNPSGWYESGRLITYRIAEDGQHRYSVWAGSRWSGAKYSLVVTCGPEGIVTHHALVDEKSGT